MIQSIASILSNIVELGLIYSLTVLSVHLTSFVIAFDDLAIEGSFALGGSLMACLLLNGINPFIATICAVIGCVFVGILMGILHTKLKMNNLILGIVVTTALFSVNLKIAGTNAILNDVKTIFDICEMSAISWLGHIPILLAISVAVFCVVKWFLQTEVGTLLYVAGNSPQVLTLLGKDINYYKTLGLVLAHAITGLSGCLFVQHIGLFSIMGNIGTLVTALAGLFIAQTIYKNGLAGFIVGAICYQSVIALTIELRCDPALNKLITAGLVIVLMALRKKK